MQKKLNSWNTLHVFSPKLDKEFNGLEYLYKRPASACDTPAENLVLMASKLIHMSKMLSICITRDDTKTIGVCQRLAEEIHLHEELATAGLYELAPDMGRDIFKMVVRFPSRMERISLNFNNILNSWRVKTTEGIPVSDKAQEELTHIFEVVIDMLESLRDVLIMSDKFMLEHIKTQGQKLTKLVEDARRANWERLEGRICRPQRASVYVEVLDSFRNVNEYVSRMYESLLYLLLESEGAVHAEKTDQ